jgi:outer membrane immunogenic protein
MKRILKLGVAAVALSIGGTAAMAADLGGAPTPPPYTPAPNYDQSFNWTGPYAGLLAGYGWTDFRDGGTTGSGWLAGGYIGYNIQSPANWVYGIEADAMWSGISGNNLNTDSIDYLATLRPRIGYAFGDFMLYGTGGLAVAGVTTTSGSTASATHVGWTVGGGVEAALTSNIVGRVEYNYVDLGSQSYSNGVTAAPTASIVKAGIGFKF